MYKYTKIKGLDSSMREIIYIIAREQKKVMNIAYHLGHGWKWNNESLQHPTS